MSREAKIIIFGLILAFSIYNNQSDSSLIDSLKEAKENNIRSVNNNLPSSNDIRKKNNDNNIDTRDVTIDEVRKRIENTDRAIVYHPQPKNGFSPYNSFFGKGIYNNNTGNEFVIKNSNSTDAVVLLVNAYSGKKVRNEYIRKGETFKMTGVPNGTYYLEWTSGNNWSPDKIVGRLKGGFQTDESFTKTRDRNDWMKVDGYQQWTVTLYTVSGGDVESESLSANEFGS